MEKLADNNTFYDDIAAEYDEMISYHTAIDKKKNILKRFINQNTKTAADIGCGSGVDSIALSTMGIKVTAFDTSTEMLKVAKENSEREKLIVTFHNNSIDSISKEFDYKFDLVVSLGNTFANFGKERLIKSLQRCKQILKPQGNFINSSIELRKEF